MRLRWLPVFMAETVFHLSNSARHVKSTVCVLFFQVDLMKNISNIPQPFLYTRHVHFLNFTRYSGCTSGHWRSVTAYSITVCCPRFEILHLTLIFLCLCLCKVQDRAAGLYQHNPGPHQPVPLQLLLPSLRWLEGRAEPPHPHSRDERWWEIPGEAFDFYGAVNYCFWLENQSCCLEHKIESDLHASSCISWFIDVCITVYINVWLLIVFPQRGFISPVGKWLIDTMHIFELCTLY